jgi:hypothetical protein
MYMCVCEYTMVYEIFSNRTNLRSEKKSGFVVESRAA